ncbi:hypothetical protein, partial [uncultured Bacteroides sp.]
RRFRPYLCVRLIIQNSMFSNFCHVLKKNLKDNAMMQEMSLQDMKDVNGGLVGVIFGLIITDIIMNPNSACEALKAGWNSWTK